MDNFNPASVSCVVSARSKGQKVEGTCSGVIISSKQTLILSHATLLAPLLQDDLKIIKSLKKSTFITDENALSKFECSIYFPPSQQHPKNLHINKTSSNSDIQNESAYYDQKPAFLLCIFQCQSLKNVLAKLIPSSEYEFADIGNSTSEASGDDVKANPQITYDLLSCFVLLKTRTCANVERYLPLKFATENKLGDQVEICSTPFGNLNPEVFLNSRSSGIISNVAGEKNVLILTDARCIPGSEGAGLFACSGDERLLTGIIIAPVCWKNNEWVGLALACSVSEILTSLTDILEYSDIRSIENCKIDQKEIVSDALKSVPLVSVGNKWGSGVVVNRNFGLVLTCSHVVRSSQPISVKVHCGRNNVCPATVLYRTPEGCQFDLAVLSVKRAWSEFQLQPEVEELVEGDPVYVIGHALFQKEHNLDPTVTSGIISKIVRINNTPVMLQTTCAVHAGASGGAVVSRLGRLVAIVVCNAKDSESGGCYPHLNMCVPISAILPVIQQFIRTEDTSILRGLYVNSSALKSLWTLGKYPSSSMEAIPGSKL